MRKATAFVRYLAIKAAARVLIQTETLARSSLTCGHEVNDWMFVRLVPLTPSLSPGERENHFPSHAKTSNWIDPHRLANTESGKRCSLSPRERVRVRGKCAPSLRRLRVYLICSESESTVFQRLIRLVAEVHKTQRYW